MKKNPSSRNTETTVTSLNKIQRPGNYKIYLSPKKKTSFIALKEKCHVNLITQQIFLQEEQFPSENGN